MPNGQIETTVFNFEQNSIIKQADFNLLESAILKLETAVNEVDNCGNCSPSNCCQSCQNMSCQSQNTTCQSCQSGFTGGCDCNCFKDCNCNCNTH